MARTLKHFSLHRIAGTELRVVSDVESGVLSVLQVEEAVIRGYAQQGLWPHRWVTLFILQNLQPLIRQLRLKMDPSGANPAGQGLPPGGVEALDSRPVVNVYDLADLESCHIFVNRQAVVREACWDDPLAIQGLLAHEHAHPLAENKTTRTSRRLQVELSIADSRWEIIDGSKRPSATGHQPSAISYQPRVYHLLTLLADELSVYSPREIFANEVTIRSGFGEALLHLDRCNMANASRSVAGRKDLHQQLQQEVSQGTLTPAAADLLLLIGDLRGYLDLALEVAPFYRTGQGRDARELEAVLETTVFPYLEPQVARTYTTLRDQYIGLRADLTSPELIAWNQEVLNTLAGVLADRGLIIQYRSQMVDKRDA